MALVEYAKLDTNRALYNIHVNVDVTSKGNSTEKVKLSKENWSEMQRLSVSSGKFFLLLQIEDWWWLWISYCHRNWNVFCNVFCVLFFVMNFVMFVLMFFVMFFVMYLVMYFVVYFVMFLEIFCCNVLYNTTSNIYSRFWQQFFYTISY